MADIKISPFCSSDIPAVRLFFDRWSGENFYSERELENILEKSQLAGLNASFCARVEGELAGVRLTYAPGGWTQGHRALSPEKWNVPEKTVAYFKSLFVSGDFQKMGIGKKLSSKSIEVLKEMGAEAILCHSWLESPGNSSQNYLQSMGFESVQEHPKFWYEVDYQCVRCAPEKCICTASEMIKYLERN